MNKEKQALLDKCIDIRDRDIRDLILGGIYIIPTRYKHDSGYKIMYIVGHTPHNPDVESTYYLLDTMCDVVNFDSWWSKVPIQDLSIDMSMGGILHVWSFRQNMKCEYNVSSCSIVMVDKDGQ